MRKLGFLLAAALAALLVADSAPAQPSWAGECGIAATQTVWADYSWGSLLPVMARPGTLIAVSDQNNTDYAAEARARGAATYAFDLGLKQKVGTPNAPADPSTIEAAAQNQYQRAVARSGGCATPLVVENELSGAKGVTPWTDANTQYRANVLAYLQDLQALGAHPVLLVPSRPYLGSSDAVNWWLQVAQVSDIVREAYIPAPLVWKLGAIRGNRLLRQSYRQSVDDFLSIGIPANRLGIMLSFLSEEGVGGRDGLEPSKAWFQVVKWFALSAKEVAAELHLGSVFSWGWQQWNPKEVDPDKPAAACVWLWARQTSLCNAPKKLGAGFDASLTEGQIALPPGAFCTVGDYGTIGAASLSRLTTVVGDPDVALSLLLERLVDAHAARATSKAILAAEQEVVDQWFGGRYDAYLTALSQANLTVAAARAALADEIRRAELAQAESVPAPAKSDIAAFYNTYAQLLIRRVHVSPAAPWLGGATDGYAVTGTAPDAVFSIPSGKTSSVTTLLGRYSVRPSGAAVELGSLPIGTVRSAIAATLESFARTQALEASTIAVEKRELNVTTCRGDDLPEPAVTDFGQYVPFLSVQ